MDLSPSTDRRARSVPSRSHHACNSLTQVIADGTSANYLHVVKKTLSIFMMLTYALMSMSAGVTVKYCCGIFSSMQWLTAGDQRPTNDHSVTFGSEGCCAKCTMQSQAATSTVPVSSQVPEPAPDVPDASSFSLDVMHPVLVFADLLPCSPNEHVQPPSLFLMNRVFRI